MHVEPRRSRLRFVNGSNACLTRCSCSFQDANTGAATDTAGPAFWQIGSHGGSSERSDRPGHQSDPGRLARARRAGRRHRRFHGRHRRLHPDQRQGLRRSGQRRQLWRVRPLPERRSTGSTDRGQVMMFKVDTARLAGTDATFNPATDGGVVRSAAAGHPAAIVNVKPAVSPTSGASWSSSRSEGLGGPGEVLLNNSEWTATASRTGTTPMPIAGSGVERAWPSAPPRTRRSADRDLGDREPHRGRPPDSTFT